MKILLVDDDLHVIQGINQNMNWNNLGIDTVLSALTADKAREWILKESVDIMICDIEMPRETGIQLLQWVRENHYGIETIFLTCFADFHYAQQAIKLESTEYLLKPVDYEKLSDAVIRATDKVREMQQSLNDVVNSQYWKLNKEKVKREVWHQLLTGTKKGDLFLSDENSHGFQYLRKDWFCCFMMLFPGMNTDCFQSRELEDYISGLGHSLPLEYELEASMPYTYPIWSLIVRTVDKNYTHIEEISEWQNLLKKRLEHRYKVILARDRWAKASELSIIATQLEKQLKHCPLSEQFILDAGEYEEKDVIYLNPDFGQWRTMILAGEYDQLMTAVKFYLHQEECFEHISITWLELFRVDMTQMVYACLSSWNISAHLLFQNNKKQYEEAVVSVKQMALYVEYLLTKSREYKRYIEQPKGIACKVRDYLDQHYCEEISREDYSRIVFMNPDYISRQFRKEFGMTIGSYILKRRLDKAKELLIDTSDPVGVISLRIGYDNYAYFSKIFRENIGMPPNEYRKKSKKSEGHHGGN